MALSGAICGFAGFLAVAAVSHTISTSTASYSRGLTIVAWLAKMNPFIMILDLGAADLPGQGAPSRSLRPMGSTNTRRRSITGVTLFFILGSEFFVNYKVKFRRQK